MQIERHEIKIFSAVVEESSFSRAAERLNISQSAVSQAVANLEHKLDVGLLERRGKLRLTEAGLRVFRFVQTVINEEQATFEDLQQLRSGALSTLSLAMGSTVNRCHGQKLLLAFSDANPLTRLKLDVVPSREIVYGVDEARWELGFGPFQKQMPGHFVLKPYFEEERILVAHKSTPNLDRLLQDPKNELATTTLLTSYLDDATKRPGSERIRHAFQSVWEVSHLELRLALMESGKGVTYLSEHLLKEKNDYYEIANLPISRFSRQVGVYYKRHDTLSEAAKRFVAICDAAFRS